MGDAVSCHYLPKGGRNNVEMDIDAGDGGHVFLLFGFLGRCALALRPLASCNLNTCVQYESHVFNSEILMAPPFSRSRIHQAALQLFAERGSSDISISDLAEAAGVARGTIYNNLEKPEDLFGQVATDLASEMYARSVASMVGISDPATRLAMGIRMFARRAHEEPLWGRFIVRFSLSDAILGKMLGEPPSVDASRGIESGRYKLDAAFLPSMVGMIGGTGLSAMRLVLDGTLTWRDAGSQSAEMILRAFGIPAREAREIATLPLPPLVDESAATPSRTRTTATRDTRKTSNSRKSA